jgi:hypothetical protein
MVKSPCYDEVTKTGCPRRCAGCSVNCSDWAAYVKDRDAQYKKKLEEAKIKRAVHDTRYCHTGQYRRDRARKRHKVY